MSAEPAAYLDSSAFVKLATAEAESSALDDYLKSWPRQVSSALLRVEALRALSKIGPQAVYAAQDWLRGMGLLPITDAVIEAAVMVAPSVVRALDAIHVATAQQLGSDLGVIVTYDRRMVQAADALGLPVAAPA